MEGKVRKELKKGTQMNSLEGGRKQMVDEIHYVRVTILNPSFSPKLQLTFAAHICNAATPDWQLPFTFAALTMQPLEHADSGSLVYL